MIRLIASDLDGTLLDDKKRLPGDFYEVLRGLFSRNIVFCAASGRTFSAVEHLFPEIVGKIAMICDNGAVTYINGQARNVFPLSREIYEKLVGVCEENRLCCVVCAESGVYHLDLGEEYHKAVGIFYKEHKTISDLRLVEGKIYKLAVRDERGALDFGKPLLDGIFGEELSVQVSGEVWMDVMARGVNKGAALRALQKTLGIKREETMAFGDYFNDLDMLLSAGESFCTENGHPYVKKQCRHVCGSCNDGGVTRAVFEYVLSGIPEKTACSGVI